MSNVYLEKPNAVKIVMQDKSGTAERYVVANDLDSVVAAVEAAFGGESVATAAAKPKKKRTRRTKAEIAAESGKPAAEPTWPG